MKHTVFYGSIYNDEFPKYKQKIREQFKNCAEKAHKEDMEIGVWGFDVLVERKLPKELCEKYVEECAKEFFPKAINVRYAK